MYVHNLRKAKDFEIIVCLRGVPIRLGGRLDIGPAPQLGADVSGGAFGLIPCDVAPTFINSSGSSTSQVRNLSAVPDVDAVVVAVAGDDDGGAHGWGAVSAGIAQRH